MFSYSSALPFTSSQLPFVWCNSNFSVTMILILVDANLSCQCRQSKRYLSRALFRETQTIIYIRWRKIAPSTRGGKEKHFFPLKGILSSFNNTPFWAIAIVSKRYQCTSLLPFVLKTVSLEFNQVQFSDYFYFWDRFSRATSNFRYCSWDSSHSLYSTDVLCALASF